MRRPKVLIADDDRGVRSALKRRLTAEGFSVVEAVDGLGVVAQALREQVDAMVLDHEMPNGDGRSVAWMIRKECAAPIVFLSGHDREEFRDAVMRLPDVYYLPKPFDGRRVADLLKAVVTRPDRPETGPARD